MKYLLVFTDISISLFQSIIRSYLSMTTENTFRVCCFVILRTHLAYLTSDLNLT